MVKYSLYDLLFFFQAEDGIRDRTVTGVQTCALPIFKLGTGVCLVVEHDPIVLAKTVATLDWLSHGRVLFGIGGGWNREEMAHHGTPFQRRWQVLRERVEAMQAIWSQEEASYAGEFVAFERIISYPKPIQQP